ncbi:serine hydroxymethyltransferase, partial [Tetragenococcus halophilus]
AKKVNSNVFPGIQGGPLEHVIAGKAVAFYEALDDNFKAYSQQILNNAKAMEAEFNQAEKTRLVSGATENHLLLIDVTDYDMTGKEAEQLLDSVHITVNKNAIPFEKLSPFKTSGIRIGTPAITSRGFKEKEAAEVARLIIKVLESNKDQAVLNEVKEDVEKLTDAHPIYTL